MKFKFSLIFFFLFSSLIYCQSKLERIYSRAVFFDKNFIFNGKSLKEPDPKKFDNPSTCLKDDDRHDKTITYYDCRRKSDLREHQIILSNHGNRKNSFYVSHVDIFGMKNYSDNVKTRSVTTKIVNGNVETQLICDYDAINRYFHKEPIELQCHLVTKEIANIVQKMRGKENLKNEEAWKNFIGHLNSKNYKNQYDELAKRAYNDIYTAYNLTITKDTFNKNLKYKRSDFESTLDLIVRLEKKYGKVNTPEEYKNIDELRDILGTNMLTMCTRLLKLWQIFEEQNN